LPNLAANVKEILRVYKPGGTFALIAEAYRSGPLRLIYGIIMPLIRAAFLSDAERPDLLLQAGFTEGDHEIRTGQELDLRHGPQTL
jgi:hypothetical protein